MPSARDLKRRIQSVKNTQQITRAMKMVSAAKLRRSQEAIVNFRPYAKKIGDLIKVVSGLPGVQTDHPAFGTPVTEAGKKRILLVLFTSDRGLCGGFNSTLIKAVSAYIREHKESGEIQVAFVGRKGHEFFKRRGFKEVYYSEFGSKIDFNKAAETSAWLVDYFKNGHCDEVHFVFSEFKNAMIQKTVIEQFLPVSAGQAPDLAQDTNENAVLAAGNLLVRPDAQTLFQELVSKHFSLQAFRVFLESQASEQGARMSAMENATRNAGDVIRKLTLVFNKQRQAGITKELLEIVAGSEAQK